ncbi:transketolase [Bacteroidetes bacterium UKL13-3]|jgi:transketolase|nr:transketolase [Bacteroidetes bacterium UKL13-3]HCP93355.1 transketolase [Bacteroidota bacterium]
MADIQKLNGLASQVRRDILRMVHGVKSGHPGGSLGCADFLTALYFEIMDHNPAFNMDAKGEDVFFLSNGHISPVFYSVLARSGYFPVSELATFRKLDSRLQGHPATAEHLPGVRIATGSLGQGISVAVGAATAKKMNKDSKLVYALMGDGEIEEGQNWEAFMFAAHHKVDNLIVTIDYNGQQIDGSTKEIMGLGDDIADKLKAFGWQVMFMNGHDMQNILDVMAQAKAATGKGKPIFVVMKTEMGYPIDFMMGSHKWHGVSPNDAELANALSQLPETAGDY